MSDDVDPVLHAQEAAGRALLAFDGPGPDAIFALLLAVRYITEMMGKSGPEAAPLIAASWDAVCMIPIARTNLS